MSLTGVAVIGGGYGDEGKGLSVDFWTSKLDNPVNFRFNGGCQAGHTGQTPDGRRHVFSHFGAGTFNEAPTYLSEFFVVNPRLFRREREQFVKQFGIYPTVYVNSHCLTTTPVEMLINQTLETLRGTTPHGSCGVGFGETFERKKQTGMALPIGYITHVTRGQVKKEIQDIINEYLPRRIDMNMVDDYFRSVISSNELIEDFCDDLDYFFTHTTILDSNSSYKMLFDRDVVFEGAQGLEIDQDYGVFPYVSRSNCGMRNVTTLIDRLGLDFDQLLVNYVTRAYKTRHGAGPLRHEVAAPFPYEDNTNIHNEWQGNLRWGKFNYEEYRSITDKDFALYADAGNPFYNVKRIDTMTCLDQLETAPRERMKNTMRMAGFNMFSYGPTREHVTVLEI